jgi:hypothetical protein
VFSSPSLSPAGCAVPPLHETAIRPGARAHTCACACTQDPRSRTNTCVGTRTHTRTRIRNGHVEGVRDSEAAWREAQLTHAK